MPKYSGNDHYIDPESGVLKNRLGITDQAVLEAAEADFAAERSRELWKTPIQGRFDLAHLQSIHRHLFGDVYEWAGELRTVDISKAGNMFAHHAHLASAAASVLKQLADEGQLTGRAPDAFSSRAAHYLGELNALHPFREGNGRAQREFISELAHQNGYYVAWENVKLDDMLKASIASFKGETAHLAAIIRENLFPLDAETPASPKRQTI